MLIKLFQKVFLYSFSFKTWWHHFFWQLLFKNLGTKTLITGRITVYNPQNVSIGKNCTLNEGVVLNAHCSIIIKDYVRISPHVLITDASLNLNQPPQKRGHYNKPVIIGEGAWLATGAVILPGVKVGKNSVISANSVVNKNVPDNVIVMGIPAKIVGKLRGSFPRQ
jgi:acetyltransferase-like isoleucine patch superfamily enzyme